MKYKHFVNFVTLFIIYRIINTHKAYSEKFIRKRIREKDSIISIDKFVEGIANKLNVSVNDFAGIEVHLPKDIIISRN